MGVEDDRAAGVDEDGTVEGDLTFDDEEEPESEQPRSRWATAREIAGGLVALLLLGTGVLLLYLIGGLASGAIAYVLTTAAPVVVVLTAAFLLARYLSRR